MTGMPIAKPHRMHKLLPWVACAALMHGPPAAWAADAPAGETAISPAVATTTPAASVGLSYRLPPRPPGSRGPEGQPAGPPAPGETCRGGALTPLRRIPPDDERTLGAVNGRATPVAGTVR